tara:strand:- start:207 stop:3446 length:3240 start_codon:yes stop_codon:yes gene_type:complete
MDQFKCKGSEEVTNVWCPKAEFNKAAYSLLTMFMCDILHDFCGSRTGRKGTDNENDWTETYKKEFAKYIIVALRNCITEDPNIKTKIIDGKECPYSYWYWTKPIPNDNDFLTFSCLGGVPGQKIPVERGQWPAYIKSYKTMNRQSGVPNIGNFDKILNLDQKAFVNTAEERMVKSPIEGGSNYTKSNIQNYFPDSPLVDPLIESLLFSSIFNSFFKLPSNGANTLILISDADTKSYPLKDIIITMRSRIRGYNITVQDSLASIYDSAEGHKLLKVANMIQRESPASKIKIRPNICVDLPQGSSSISPPPLKKQTFNVICGKNDNEDNPSIQFSFEFKLDDEESRTKLRTQVIQIPWDLHNWGEKKLGKLPLWLLYNLARDRGLDVIMNSNYFSHAMAWRRMALQDYQPRNAKELTFKKGDVLQVIDQSNRGKLGNKTGFFSQNHVRFLEPEELLANDLDKWKKNNTQTTGKWTYIWDIKDLIRENFADFSGIIEKNLLKENESMTKDNIIKNIRSKFPDLFNVNLDENSNIAEWVNMLEGKYAQLWNKMKNRELEKILNWGSSTMYIKSLLTYTSKLTIEQFFNLESGDLSASIQPLYNAKAINCDSGKSCSLSVRDISTFIKGRDLKKPEDLLSLALMKTFGDFGIINTAAAFQSASDAIPLFTTSDELASIIASGLQKQTDTYHSLNILYEAASTETLTPLNIIIPLQQKIVIGSAVKININLSTRISEVIYGDVVDFSNNKETVHILPSDPPLQGLIDWLSQLGWWDETGGEKLIILPRDQVHLVNPASDMMAKVRSDLKKIYVSKTIWDSARSWARDGVKAALDFCTSRGGKFGASLGNKRDLSELSSMEIDKNNVLQQKDEYIQALKTNLRKCRSYRKKQEADSRKLEFQRRREDRLNNETFTRASACEQRVRVLETEAAQHETELTDNFLNGDNKYTTLILYLRETLWSTPATAVFYLKEIAVHTQGGEVDNIFNLLAFPYLGSDLLERVTSGNFSWPPEGKSMNTSGFKFGRRSKNLYDLSHLIKSVNKDLSKEKTKLLSKKKTKVLNSNFGSKDIKHLIKYTNNNIRRYKS